MSTPLELPSDTLALYTEGYCHVLALALYERLGTSMQVLRGWTGEDTLIHVTCEHPDGQRIIDVHGVRTTADVELQWPDVLDPYWTDAYPDEIAASIEEYVLEGYTAEAMTVARAVAAQIIRHYDLESSSRNSA